MQNLENVLTDYAELLTDYAEFPILENVLTDYAESSG
jgi:hypothetical protein